MQIPAALPILLVRLVTHSELRVFMTAKDRSKRTNR